MSWHQIASNWLRPKPRDRGKSLGNNMRFRIALGSGATILLKVNHMRVFSHLGQYLTHANWARFLLF